MSLTRGRSTFPWLQRRQNAPSESLFSLNVPRNRRAYNGGLVFAGAAPSTTYRPSRCPAGRSVGIGLLKQAAPTPYGHAAMHGTEEAFVAPRRSRLPRYWRTAIGYLSNTLFCRDLGQLVGTSERREHAVNGIAGLVVAIRPEVPVRVERLHRRLVAKAALDRLD